MDSLSLCDPSTDPAVLPQNYRLILGQPTGKDKGEIDP
jgi:hypothetical protein